MVLPTSGDYTSIAAAAGLGASDSLAVETSYSLALEWALNNYGIMRQFVSKRPEQVPHPAQTVTMKKWNYFSEAAVTAAKTPLNEVADVAARRLPAVTNVVIEAAEYGDVVEHTEFFEGRALVPFEAAKATTLADQSAKVIDELIQDQILADITETVKAEGIKVLAADVREAGLQFLEDNVPTYGGGFYYFVGHPRVLGDLRAEAGFGGWRVPKEYVDASALKALPNELGEFEGFRFISNNRVRSRAADSDEAQRFNSYLFGAGGLAEHVVTAPQVRVAPQTDALRRFHGLGWYFDMGWKVYEPLAIKVIQATATGADPDTTPCFTWRLIIWALPQQRRKRLQVTWVPEWVTCHCTRPTPVPRVPARRLAVPLRTRGSRSPSPQDPRTAPLPVRRSSSTSPLARTRTWACGTRLRPAPSGVARPSRRPSSPLGRMLWPSRSQ